MRSSMSTAVALTIVGLMLTAPPAHGQQALQLGPMMQGTAGSETPAVFTFDAESAGVLTVVVRGSADADLVVTVTDEVGQTLPDGQSDQDLGGDSGAEQIAAVIPGAGRYQVRVSTWFGTGPFELAAGWIAYPSLGSSPDPDGMPTAAAALTPGSPIQDSIDTGAGDAWDWYKVTVDSAAAITVIVEAPEGDLVLEVFSEGSYAEALNRSDEDMQGVAGNESITVQAQPGETYYFKVLPFGGGHIPYTIRVGIM